MKLREVTRIAVAARPRTVSVCAHAVAIGAPGAALAVHVLRSGKSIGQLPEGVLSEVDAATDAGIVEREGVTRGGVFTWTIELWDLARAKRTATLARCTPTDKLGKFVFVGADLYAIRAQTRGDARTWSLVVLDRKGAVREESALATKVVPFHLAVAGGTAAWAYFDGKAGVVDLATGKQAALSGGALRIGRQHEKGLDRLTIDAAGRYALASSGGVQRVIVWDLRTRKALTGPWEAAGTRCGAIVGDHACWWTDGSALAAARLGGGSAVTMKSGGDGRVVPLGDARHVVWAGAKAVEVWDVVTGKRAAAAKLAHAATCVDAAAGHVVVGDDGDGAVVFAVG